MQINYCCCRTVVAAACFSKEKLLFIRVQRFCLEPFDRAYIYSTYCNLFTPKLLMRDPTIKVLRRNAEELAAEEQSKGRSRGSAVQASAVIHTNIQYIPYSRAAMEVHTALVHDHKSSSTTHDEARLYSLFFFCVVRLTCTLPRLSAEERRTSTRPCAPTPQTTLVVYVTRSSGTAKKKLSLCSYSTIVPEGHLNEYLQRSRYLIAFQFDLSPQGILLTVVGPPLF